MFAVGCGGFRFTLQFVVHAVVVVSFSSFVRFDIVNMQFAVIISIAYVMYDDSLVLSVFVINF